MAYGVSEGGKDETRIDDRSVEKCILVCAVSWYGDRLMELADVTTV